MNATINLSSKSLYCFEFQQNRQIKKKFDILKKDIFQFFID